MKTIQDILALFPETKEEDWKQHANGKGWVKTTAHAADKCLIIGVVSGNAQVSDNAQVSGDAHVSGDARVSGNARVYGNAWVYGDAEVYGKARVWGDGWVTTPLFVQGTKHGASNCKKGYIAVGCEVHTFAEWQENFEAIGKENEYSEAQIAEYKAIIDLFVRIGK